MTAIRVTIATVKGSAPREAGTAMLVYGDRIEGTIGGGALEWEAMCTARAMLQDGTTRQERQMALGPALGQCCGGAVTLVFEATEDLPNPPGRPVWIWGAGHVGRAIADVLAPLPQVTLTWADTAADRFPAAIPAGAERVISQDLPRLMPHAPKDAVHLILTYSHDIDLELCHGALQRGFAACGLIGSATKWARFQSKLRNLGHPDAQISRITCPIGDPDLGKHPQAIAIGVATRLLTGHMLKNQADAAMPGET